ncbi:MAG: thiamine phosphate synthase [bacterium]|nr:thiamine phosphate synthase [bacterium]
MIWGIYPIVDSGVKSGFSEEEFTRLILAARPPQIQLRIKHQTDREFFLRAQVVRKITKESGVNLIINDRIDVALALKAEGVHLGQDDLPLEAARALCPPEMIVGISVRSVAEAENAERGGAGYVAFGPVFPTASKTGAEVVPGGLAELKRVVDSVSVPVVAIGGIGADNLREVIAAGAAGASMISALAFARDVTETVKSFQLMFAKNRKEKKRG